MTLLCRAGNAFGAPCDSGCPALAERRAMRTKNARAFKVLPEQATTSPAKKLGRRILVDCESSDGGRDIAPYFC
jgi:hypothetical protein